MNGKWEIIASDNTGFKLECKNGIITLQDKYGNLVCEFMDNDIACEPEYLGKYFDWMQRWAL